MQGLNFTNRLRCGLKALGFVRDWSDRSSKYEAYVYPGKEEDKIFLGSKGALRWGKCSTQSRAIGDPSNITRQYNIVLNAEIMRAVICIREAALEQK